MKKAFSWVRNLKLKPNDVIKTPDLLVKKLVLKVPLIQGDRVLDAFAGEMVWYNNYPDYVIKNWCELSKGIDFLQYTEEFDWVVSNPPYSCLNIMLKKMYKAQKGFALLLNVILLTPQRVKDMADNGFIIDKLHFCNVRGWFGKQVFIICLKKPQSIGDIVSYDTEHYKMPVDERKIYDAKQKAYQADYHKKHYTPL